MNFFLIFFRFKKTRISRRCTSMSQEPPFSLVCTYCNRASICPIIRSRTEKWCSTQCHSLYTIGIKNIHPYWPIAGHSFSQPPVSWTPRPTDLVLDGKLKTLRDLHYLRESKHPEAASDQEFQEKVTDFINYRMKHW